MSGGRGGREQGRGAEAVARLPFSPSPLPLFWLAAVALAIGLAPLPELLAGAGLALGLALPLLSPALGVALAVLSVPVQELVSLPAGLSVTQAAVLLMAAGWALRAGYRGWGLAARDEVPPGAGRTSLSSLVPWLVLLWALLLSASLTPFSRAEALKETARWGVAFLAWLVAATSLRRRWHLHALLAALLAAPAATAAIGLWQFATGDGPPSFRIAAGLPFVRAYGTIGQPNSFAGYMNMAWPLALALAVFATVDRRRTDDGRPTTAGPHWIRVAARWALVVGLWSVTALLLGGLAASFSRGAWLGAAVGLLGLAATLGRRPALAVASLLGAGVLALALGGAGLLPAPVASRLESISRSVAIFDAGAVEVTPQNFAAVERMAQIQAGWRMLRERPLLGVGPGNYSVVYPRVAVGEWYASRGHAHNYYLHMAAEAGLLGLGAYLALLAAVTLRAVRAARRARDSLERAIAVGCCGMIAAVAGHNLFENLHVLNMGIQIAGTWAMVEVVGRRSAGLVVSDTG